MKLVIAMMGIMVLAAVPGHARSVRDIRMPVRMRLKAVERQALQLLRLRGERRENFVATSTQKIIAIDSETGEPCFVSGRQAGLLKS